MTSIDGLHRHVPSTNGERELMSRDAIGIPRGPTFSAMSCSHRCHTSALLRQAGESVSLGLLIWLTIGRIWKDNFYNLQHHITVALNAIYWRRCCVSFSHVRNVLSNSSYLEEIGIVSHWFRNKLFLCWGGNWIQTQEPRPLCDKRW